MQKSPDLSRRAFATAACCAAVGGITLLTSGDAVAATVSAGERKCATCNFWGGQRTAAADKKSVTVADGARGKCGNPNSPLYNKDSRFDQGFQQGWKQWEALA
ncbi:MAG: hypothetical protein L6Q71_01410 [Planctomycetes bacterium]|nr:hypothetical protein [Planctomycetota bacterium]